MSNNLSGRPFNFIEFNLYFYGEMDPDCPTLTRQQKDQIHNAMRMAAPKVEGVQERIVVFGIGGDMENGPMSDMFYNSDEFDLLKT